MRFIFLLLIVGCQYRPNNSFDTTASESPWDRCVRESKNYSGPPVNEPDFVLARGHDYWIGRAVRENDFCAWREFFISRGMNEHEASYRARRISR